MSDLFRGISDDRSDPASFAIEVDKFGAIHAIVALPSDGEAGIGFLPVNWFRVPIRGQPGRLLENGSASLSLSYAAPSLSSISLTVVSVGSAATTLTLTGSGFSRASTFNLDGNSLAASPLTITTPGKLQPGVVGTAYSFPLSASGGTTPYHWSANGLTCSNSIPGLDGICVSDRGVIQGTPTTAANAPIAFTLHVTDSSATAQSATKSVSLIILPQDLPPQVNTVTADPSTVEAGGASALTCSPFDPQQLPLTYSWNVTGGNISRSGANVSWTAPSAQGQFTATCKVTSSANLGATVVRG